MKQIVIILFLSLFLASATGAQSIHGNSTLNKMEKDEILKLESHVAGLQIALTHRVPAVPSNDYAVLFLHGSTFPSAMAFGFKMNHYSWVDHLSENGYEVYALDFLGYGNSDRYPEMEMRSPAGTPVGRALDVYQDVDKAVEWIIRKTGKTKVYLIGHSWGGSVAALYATRFPDKVAKLVLFAVITQRGDTTVIPTIERSYASMTPEERVAGMKSLAPEKESCPLEPEVFTGWGTAWLQSDPLAKKFQSAHVIFPSGPLQDIEDMLHGKPYYNPADLRVPVLLIRGEWDAYPDHADGEKFFVSLERAPYKKYVVIEKGTHVMHLEKNRYQLYEETLRFLTHGRSRVEANKHAIAVIFEVIPAAGYKQEYLDMAAALKPQLEKVKGFLSIERFQSIYHPEKILSLSFWESEEAIQQWRNLELHRSAQSKGRKYIFKDYHLRIAQVVRDYGMSDRKEAPADSKSYHE